MGEFNEQFYAFLYKKSGATSDIIMQFYKFYCIIYNLIKNIVVSRYESRFLIINNI